MVYKNNNPKICDTCRYWSEMVAQSNGYGVDAMCLNEKSPNKHKMIAGSVSCDVWEDGYFGAIDAPGNENAYNKAVHGTSESTPPVT